MARGTATPPAITLDVLAPPGESGRGIARVLGVPTATVSDLLAKYQPVAEGLRTFQRDHFVGGWQFLYLDAMSQLARLATYETASLKDEHVVAATRRDISVSMGIATEKTLLLNGMPSAIVGHLHEVRIDLPGLVSRLADVSSAMRQIPAVVVEAER